MWSLGAGWCCTRERRGGRAGARERTSERTREGEGEREGERRERGREGKTERQTDRQTDRLGTSCSRDAKISSLPPSRCSTSDARAHKTCAPIRTYTRVSGGSGTHEYRGDQVAGLPTPRAPITHMPAQGEGGYGSYHTHAGSHAHMCTHTRGYACTPVPSLTGASIYASV